MLSGDYLNAVCLFKSGDYFECERVRACLTAVCAVAMPTIVLLLAHVIQLRDMVRCRPRRGRDVRVTLKRVLKNEWFPMSRPLA